jgi:hypothetical protein
MDKKFLAILLVASSFVSSAFATNIINKLISKHDSATSSIVKTHKTVKQTNHPYTDFSGTWTATCGNGVSLTTVIENDADYISFDGEESSIGHGLQGKSESNDTGSEYSHASFEWNANGSTLTIKDVGFSKSNLDDSAIETGISKFTLAMKNGQINLDGKAIAFEDLTQIGQPIMMHCVFSKKQ